jgi:hypothetical protein
MLLAACIPGAFALAQTSLPAPSRSIFKCQVNGKISYSDEPCVGAQRLDATPVSGVTHLSGSSKIGKDVANEIYIEQHAKVFRPLTGMSAIELTTATRRNQLIPTDRRECYQLEPIILALEHAERRATAATIQSIQQDLFVRRKRYKELGC